MSAEEYKPSETTAHVLAKSVEVIGQNYRPPVLTTVQATFARSALAELNTHRAFSRNSASSRAIPVTKMLKLVTDTPFIPRRFSLAQKGMHASEFVQPGDSQWKDCVEWWIDSRDEAIFNVKRGLALGIHKQDVNRILEPFMLHTAIISATEWQNFYDQRLATDEAGNPLAYPPIYDLAKAIKDAIDAETPKTLTSDQWHLPMVGFDGDESLTVEELIKVSIARCARVSYLTHDGQRDIGADIHLFERLISYPHLSPFEHAAHPGIDTQRYGNFQGWVQARCYVEREEWNYAMRRAGDHRA